MCPLLLIKRERRRERHFYVHDWPLKKRDALNIAISFLSASTLLCASASAPFPGKKTGIKVLGIYRDKRARLERR